MKEFKELNLNISKVLEICTREKKRLEFGQKRMEDIIDLFVISKESIEKLQKRLSEAYGVIEKLERYRDDYERSQHREKELVEQHAMLNAKIMDITKENAELRIQSKAIQEMYEKNIHQMTCEKKRSEELEMKLVEMNRLSTDMARKLSEKAMQKALRTYANTSKRKSLDKRAFAKQAILELANVNGLTLPEDLSATIDSLDDERPDPARVVNVSHGGQYNDIHDNSTVNQK